MPNQELPKKQAKFLKAYHTAALILFNSFLCFIILNVIIFLIFKVMDKFSPNVIFQKYSKVNFNSLYPEMSRSQIDDLLKETWSRNYEYEPFTQFKERPYKGFYVNIDEKGFRYTKNQGPWPPQSDNINVFLFGGSTTFGYGVADTETIASYLQEYLTGKLGREVRVYNFGRGYYYSTQERILYEHLLTTGFVPDLAIFIDGLNDISYKKDEPEFTDRMRQTFTGIVETSKKFIFQTPLGQVAGMLRDKILSPARQDQAGRECQDSETSMLAKKTIDRYLMNKKLLEAASTSFGVKPFFIWQPIPTYNVDQSNYAFKNEVYENPYYAKYAYGLMADLVKEKLLGNDFIWCADLQQGLTVPVYVDRVHYTAQFSKIFAQAIADQILARGNLKKPSDPLIPNP